MHDLKRPQCVSINGLARMLQEKKIFPAQEVLVHMVGESEAIKVVKRDLVVASTVLLPVLLSGPSGTGKERAASIIHLLSERCHSPFIAINCAAIPHDLAESTFFGHEKGAFTGATKRQQGKFEVAHEGTLFLDEIADLPLTLQAKILRALESGYIERVGSNSQVPVDIRIICAVNTDLFSSVMGGSFREDLYYRIAGFAIDLPPLSKRRDDIPLLAMHFLDVFNTTYNTNIVLSKDASDALVTLDYRGHVRQLRHIVELAATLAKYEGTDLNMHALQEALKRSKVPLLAEKGNVVSSHPLVPLGKIDSFPKNPLLQQLSDRGTFLGLLSRFDPFKLVALSEDSIIVGISSATDIPPNKIKYALRVHRIDVEAFVIERRLEKILAALRSSTELKHAAEALGMTEASLKEKLGSYGVNASDHLAST
ncbi:sigma-54-dependent Fis family transcriptional regulator [Candidatus Micrarchaeota archaeon]|nr:sigma-54-dependent Fis family transcriptional regulator [Candidatus Micrarchaeota archaeon]